VNTPLIIQMQSVECGAACLGIILGYYGKFVSLGELRHKCGVTRDGCNGLDILKAGHSYELSGQAFQTNAEALVDIRKPAILFWDTAHFVVLEGFSKNKVFINDPSYGHMEIERAEFDVRYSGIAFIFDPKPSFKRSAMPREGFISLAKSWKLRPSFFLFLALSCFLLVLPFLTLPTLLRLFIDFVYESDVLQWKELCLIFCFGALGFGLIFSLFYFSSIHRAFRSVSMQSSSRFFWRMLRLPVTFYDEREPREIALRLNENQDLQKAFIEEFLPAQTLLLFSFIYACILFSYDIVTASLTMIASLATLICMYAVDKKRIQSLALFEKDAKLSQSYGLEILHSMEAIKASGSENYFFTKWLSHYTRFINAEQIIGKKGIFLSVAPLFIQLFCTGLLLGFGGSHVLSGKLTLGMLAAFQVFFILFVIPFRTFVGLSERFARGRKELLRTNDILYTETDPLFSHEGSYSKELTGHLEFKDVVFSYYPSSPPIVQELSFTLRPGEWLGITGQIGSGKSTVGKLCAALLHPRSGRILFDGKKIREIAPDVFRNSVCWIGRQSYLFEASLKDNIALWREVSKEDLYAACKKALIHEWIMNLPQQYETKVLSHGKNLSHGQKQQIEIARAFLVKPKLLILDEALNSLDRDLQQKILQSLKQEKISCLLISVQESLLQECDEIFFLEEGKRIDT
jgi:ATP-binding cassette, subfamily C, bacterial